MIETIVAVLIGNFLCGLLLSAVEKFQERRERRELERQPPPF